MNVSFVSCCLEVLMFSPKLLSLLKLMMEFIPFAMEYCHKSAMIKCYSVTARQKPVLDLALGRSGKLRLGTTDRICLSVLLILFLID